MGYMIWGSHYCLLKAIFYLLKRGTIVGIQLRIYLLQEPTLPKPIPLLRSEPSSAISLNPTDGEYPKLGIQFWVVPMIRAIRIGNLCWGPPFWQTTRSHLCLTSALIGPTGCHAMGGGNMP